LFVEQCSSPECLRWLCRCAGVRVLHCRTVQPQNPKDSRFKCSLNS